MFEWLPPGKRAAIVFSVDDVHPGYNTNGNQTPADPRAGNLAHVGWLLERHPQLRVTLFTTADWRQTSPLPRRKLVSRIPFVRDHSYLSPTHPTGTFRLGRHPDFVQYLKEFPRVEIGLHGLNHVRRGPGLPIEFEGRSVSECARMLRESIAIFEEAGLTYSPGMTPPGWELSDNLASAMVEVGLQFVASARDIRTPVSQGAVTNMSGLKGVSLIHPQLIRDNQLVHFTSNFQATCPVDRAIEIVECGGLLAIKAHIIKNASGHIALDGMDELYRNYLDLLFAHLENTYADSLWWTSMGELSDRIINTTGS